MVVHTNKHHIPFLIDDDDWSRVKQRKWYISGGYPATATPAGPLPLHLFLLGRAPKGFEWDHINRNKIDNRRQNLRMVTSLVNRMNRGPKETIKIPKGKVKMGGIHCSQPRLSLPKQLPRPSNLPREPEYPHVPVTPPIWAGRRPLWGWSKLLYLNKLPSAK